jgi:putative heme-binding domain-containing protein
VNTEPTCSRRGNESLITLDSRRSSLDPALSPSRLCASAVYWLFLVAILAVNCLLQGSHAATFQVPTNFVVQLAAAEPNIQFPMFACLDNRGRLFVTESSGLDLYKEISAGTRKCQVRILEDRDNDGAYETASVFADKLVFPMGLAWREGKLYIADPPELITLEDTDRDGRADKRTVILSSFGARDNGSLHGLLFGPDGFLYMTIGQPDGYEFNLPNGAVLKGDSGALVRCRPDGSHPEILARGFENPVEVVFMPGGEIIGTVNWYQKPAAGLRDALWHLVEGGLYPRHPDNFTRYPITGDPLPALSMFPAVALSGLARYDGGQFPAEFRGNLFSAKHNSRSVGRHVLHRIGSTFRSDDSDFLTTEDPDFHPSDVLLDRDGSLLVLDTGSWYTDHCPTGKIRKSPAKGGIYRVRYKGPERRATTNDPMHELWAKAGDTNRLLAALKSNDPEMIAAAVRIAGTTRQTSLVPEISKLISSTNPVVQLAAAEVLARCGDRSVLPALVSTLTNPVDRFLEHAAVHALHQIIGEQEVPLQRMLEHRSPRVQRAALVLLSQPPRPPAALKVDAVVARLQSPDAELRRTAVELLASRSEWTAEALRIAKKWLGQNDLADDQRIALRALCAAFYNTGRFQEALRGALDDGAPAVRVLVLDTLAAQPAPREESRWTPALRKVLHHGALHERTVAARVAVVWRLSELKPDLLQIAQDPTQPASLRLESLRDSIAGYDVLPDPFFEFLLARWRGGDALFAGELLRKARLTDTQLTRAIRSANSVVPPATLLVAFRKSTTPEHSRELLQAVSTMPVAGWDEREYGEFVSRFPAELRTEAEALTTRFAPDAQARHARIARYEPLLRGGDVGAGAIVFRSAKVACIVCHTAGEGAANIGPDLTRIGAVRSGRDLLESILFPSSTFAQGYESFAFETNDGEDHSGTIVQQNEDKVSVRTAAGTEMTFARAAIKNMRRTFVSAMPEGLEAALSEEEFRDLLAFLQSLK